MEFEHALKNWEKRYGYIGLPKDMLKAFPIARGKRFTVNIEGERLLERYVDTSNRIYIGKYSLRDFKIGDRISLSMDGDTIMIKKVKEG